MSCDQISERLDDYVDGLLHERVREQVERHLDRCLDCATLVEELRALQRAVAELPDEVAPSRNLFPEIRAALGAVARPRWPVWAGIAAALFLAALVLRTGLQIPGELQPQKAPAARAAQARQIHGLVSNELEAAERQFLEASAELLDTLKRRRAALSPETRSVLDENLAIMDRAISEVRSALEADPGNLESGRSLHALYRQKLHFLWTASRVSS